MPFSLGSMHPFVATPRVAFVGNPHKGSIPRNETVVLLHALWRGPASLLRVARILQDDGFRTVGVAYPTTRGPLFQLSDAVMDIILEATAEDTQVHVVAHSLGGIVLRAGTRAWLLPETVAPAKDTRSLPARFLNTRAVLMGTPNDGSEVVTMLAKAGLSGIMERMGSSLLPDLDAGSPMLRTALPKRLPFSTGLIAGVQRGFPLHHTLFKDRSDPRNDRVVSVSSAFSLPAEDRVVLNAEHTLMPFNRAVCQATLSFLRHGAFDPLDP